LSEMKLSVNPSKKPTVKSIVGTLEDFRRVVIMSLAATKGSSSKS